MESDREALAVEPQTVEQLQRVAVRIRRTVLSTIHDAGVGHMGGALSIADILAVLYFHTLRIDPTRPDWPDRDRFILSKGHASVALYSTLALRGYFGLDWMREFDQIGGRLQGHPDMLKTPGVDMTTGSLGQGLSAGIGMALGRDRRRQDFRVWVLLSDGELQEGQVWEAAMYAGCHRVGKLTAIVDYNQLQLTGWTHETLSVEPVVDKWRAFGWEVLCCDGHSIPDLLDTLARARQFAGGPVAVVARTLKGHGVSFMQGKVEWHARAPTDAEFAQAIGELGEHQ